jgi:hypothetical protein
MANADKPQGLRPYGPVKMQISAVAGTRVFPGDAVQLQNDGKVDPVAAGATIYGVALSYADADGDDVLLSVHPEQQYTAQCDGSAINAQTIVGNNVDLLATAGNTTYNQSRMELDTSTVAAAAAQLTILGVDRSIDNAFGEFVDVIVRINEHQTFGKDAFAGI